LPPLYKYLSSQYLEAFLVRGEVLFRSLSYFRRLEEMEVRGDAYEGVRLFAPNGGLEIRKNGSEVPERLPMAFEAKVQEREILVFCLSTCLSPALASEFGADTCVEILEPEKFIASVQRALLSRPSLKSKRLVHGLVSYYEPETPPLAAWAVPEQVALSKLTRYERQAEYRLAVGRRRAFELENVQTQLTSTPGLAPTSLSGHPKAILTAGSLKAICRVHTFP